MLAAELVLLWNPIICRGEMMLFTRDFVFLWFCSFGFSNMLGFSAWKLVVRLVCSTWQWQLISPICYIRRKINSHYTHQASTID